MGVLRTKSVEQSIRDTEEPEHRLHKELSARDLTVLGIGVIIGTGIFVLTGVAAKDNAGPAVALSFVAAGVVCALAALCYAEFASTVPVAGSAYTFSYASVGELVAWVIGWDLVLELALGGSVVAVGWSQYLAELLDTMGLTLPTAVASAEEGMFNLPAALVVLALTGVIIAGIKISSRVNAVVVTIKVAIVLLVIVAGLFFVKAANYTPFLPEAQPAPPQEGATAPLVQVLFGLTPTNFGVAGIFTAAAIVFFAFIGFDVVATTAEETRHPQRDVPVGILSSLAVCTGLYVAVSLVVVGMQEYTELDTAAPLAAAFTAVGQDWIATVITVGALAGLTTVMMILLLGQTRVFFAMSRDRLLPPVFSRVSPRLGTPYRTSLVTGCAVALMAGLIELESLATLVNIGTLFAFLLVSAGVLVLRVRRPDLRRAFRVPAVWLVAPASILACLYLMLYLPLETWGRFGAWMGIGLLVYAVYGARRSRLRTEGDVAAGRTPERQRDTVGGAHARTDGSR